jgi:hypothetical protein
MRLRGAAQIIGAISDHLGSATLAVGWRLRLSPMRISKFVSFSVLFPSFAQIGVIAESVQNRTPSHPKEG